MRLISNRSSFLLLTAVTGVTFTLTGGRAFGDALTGTISYTDFDSVSQPVRDGLVDIYSTNGTTQTLLGTATTSTLGTWSANFTAPTGSTGYVISAVAQNAGTSVSDGTNPVYNVSAGTIALGGGSTSAVINTQTGGFAAKSFELADSLYTSYVYGQTVRGTALASVPIVYGPQAVSGIDDGAAFYTHTGPGDIGHIAIGAGSVYDWDTMNHEYGHYTAATDNLDQNPGGGHGFGASDIPANGRLNGLRLAWGEGIASYMGITAQQTDATRPNSFGNNNLSYDFFDNTVHPGTYLEQDSVEATIPNLGGTPKGEGDELSTMRVLWDLADNTPTEAHDRVAMGSQAVYSMMATQHFDQLGQVWNYLSTSAGSNNTLRVDYGGIFQLANVSPDPTDATINGTILTAGSPAPTFSWLKGNDDGTATPEANDLFHLIVFNSTYTTELLDILIPGDVTTYTLTPSQWATLEGSPGLDEYVITGEDNGLDAPAANLSTAAGIVDADYWSDSYSFTVSAVPEPTAIALLALGGIGLVGRRRRTDR